MAITDQLKSLYVKLGGDPNTGASNIEEWIDKIEDVAGSGSGSGEDSGGDSSGLGSKVLIAHVTVDDPTQQTWTYSSDYTFEELLSAYNQGYEIFVRHNAMVIPGVPEKDDPAGEYTRFAFYGMLVEISNNRIIAVHGVISSEGASIPEAAFYGLQSANQSDVG